jgi:hypothetical protein
VKALSTYSHCSARHNEGIDVALAHGLGGGGKGYAPFKIDVDRRYCF